MQTPSPADTLITMEAPPLPDAGALYDRAACGLVVTAADGTLLRVNATFCDGVGYAAETLVGGRRLQELLTADACIAYQTHWAPLLQTQGAVAPMPLDFVHRDGRVLPMGVSAVRRVHGGAPLDELALFRAEGGMRDEHEPWRDPRPTETVRVEGSDPQQALLRAQEDLRQALEARRAAAEDRALFAEQMIGIVSHDLRNPLSAIQMSALLLARTAPTESQQRAITRIGNATARANRMIGDLLDFTQARLGRGLQLRLGEVDLQALVAGRVEELAPVFPDRSLVHRHEGSGICSADADRLGQLVSDLVGDAVSHGAPRRPVTVTSTVTATHCTIAVHHEGEPMPADLLPHLFEPIIQGEGAGFQVRSVGLGLFIVREIARAHGGEVGVVSSADQGTTFCATFPRRAAEGIGGKLAFGPH